MKFGIPFKFELCTVTALKREKLGSCDTAVASFFSL